MFVKICGLSTADALEAAVAASADAIGFVFARSPRQVSPQRAVALCRDLPRHIIRVAVMHHPTEEQWAEVRDTFAPDWLQSDAEDFAALSLPQGCQALPVYREAQAAPSDALPLQLLFEGKVSGSGQPADWAQAAALARRSRLILAGGLDPDNVGEAIGRVAPWGVDVSSGVEEAPGHKNPAKIRDFIARARAAERVA